MTIRNINHHIIKNGDIWNVKRTWEKKFIFWWIKKENYIGHPWFDNYVATRFKTVKEAQARIDKNENI